MKFNLTPSEFTLFICVCLAVYVWAKYVRRLHRWLHDWNIAGS